MSSTRVAAVARRIIQQFLRDRRTLALVFLVPVGVILLLGYILRTAEGRTELGLVDETTPGGPPVAALTVDFLGGAGVSVREMGLAEAKEAVRDGEVDGFAVLAGDFSGSAAAGEEPRIDLTLEGSRPQTSQRLSRVLQQAAALLGQQLAGGGGTAPALPLTTGYVYAGPEFETIDFEAPVLVGFFAFFFVFLLTVVSFLRERTHGTLERIMVTPASRSELLLGYMLGFGIFALLQALVIVLVAVLILQINYEGNLFLIFVMTAALSLGGVNLGIFLSTFARTELQAIQFMPIVIVPQGLLSGVIWPVDDLPGVLAGVAQALPLTYANAALRDIMLKGQGITDEGVYVNLVVLLAFAAAFLALGAMTLRRRLD